MKKGILWIASYPKSGNVWFRLFLANLKWGKEVPVSIHDRHYTPVASDRRLFDESTGIRSSDFTEEEIEQLRPRVYEQIAHKNKGPLFMKIHDAYTYTAKGTPLISIKGTLGAVYIIRNPLDVCASMSHFAQCNPDETISRMSDETYAFCSNPSRLESQLRQRLLTWSGHVLSWVDSPHTKVHVMRYEDMHLKPLETFSRVAQFCSISKNLDEIQKAINFCSFEESKRQEETRGYESSSGHARYVFRKGKIGSWKGALTTKQKEKIVCDHSGVMKRFGYLTEYGKVVF